MIPLRKNANDTQVHKCGFNSSNHQFEKVLKGTITPYPMLINSIRDEATQEVIEGHLKSYLRPKDVEVGLLSMRRIAKGAVLVTE